ncbi:14987_t:CDS:2, partial [Funneliformis geosporum]
RKRLHLNEDNLSLSLVPDNPRLSTPRVLIETDNITPNSMVMSDEKMKEMLKRILENDKSCDVKLKELEKKGISYDRLWNEALYSNLLRRNRVKKGYYIWQKINSDVRKVYEDLYSLVDSDDTYLSLIIKKVFVSEDEQMRKKCDMMSSYTRNYLQ